MAALASSGPTELITLIQELHSSNNNSIKRVNQLEQALAECQEALESHKALLSRRVDAHPTNSGTRDCPRAGEVFILRTGSFSSNCPAQQILIETLTAQLESSQERVYQLEQNVP